MGPRERLLLTVQPMTKSRKVADLLIHRAEGAILLERSLYDAVAYVRGESAGELSLSDRVDLAGMAAAMMPRGEES